MKSTVDATRTHLKAAIDKNFALYEKLVPSKKILAHYLVSTKRTLIWVIEEAFDEKIKELDE